MQGHFHFATWECRILIRVEGYATLQNSFIFQDFVNRMVQQGCHDFIVDLSQCQCMDSTFMGILVSITEPCADQKVALALTLINPQENHLRSLESLGIANLLSIAKAPISLPQIPMQTVEEISSSPLSRLKTIQQAHRSLLALSSNHQKEFAEFLEMVEQELQQHVLS